MPNKFLLASTAVVAGLVMSASAQAGVEILTFTGYDGGGQELTATMSLDVVGGQAVSGTGAISSPYGSGSEALSLVDLSTLDVHDLGAGGLSYRFGGGTDLIGDTSVPIDGNGLVFQVAGAPALNLGFNIWSNGGGSYTGFLAGNGVYDGFNGQLVSGAVPEPATWAMLILGVAMIGFAARRRNAGAALAA